MLNANIGHAPGTGETSHKTPSGEPPLPLGVAVTMGALTVGFVWILLCIMASAYLGWRVPISAQDIAWASWQGSYTTSTHPIGYMIVIGGSFMGLLFVVLSRSPILALVLVIMSLMLGMGSSEKIMIPVGIAHGTIKIGCFTPNSRECNAMLGIADQGAPSFFAPSKQGQLGQDYADWYTAQWRQQPVSLMASVPGGYFFMSPLYVFRAQKIEATLQRQRKAVVDLRAQFENSQQ